jgi:hypothetical protein
MQQINEREQWQNWELKAEEGSLDNHLVKSQLYLVAQTAHASASIRSSDGDAWIRCIAFCPSLDSAYQVARNAHDSGDKMETRIFQAGKCALIPQTKRTKGDLDKMLEDQKKANRRYDDHVAERIEIIKGNGKCEEKASVPIKAAEATVSTLTTTSMPTSISMDFGKPREVFMQKYFALGLIQDTDSSLREPVIIPLAAAETMEALQELVKPMSNNIDLIHVDIFCGTLLEWLPLNNPKSKQVFHKHPLRQALEEKIKWIHKTEGEEAKREEF